MQQKLNNFLRTELVISQVMPVNDNKEDAGKAQTSAKLTIPEKYPRIFCAKRIRREFSGRGSLSGQKDIFQKNNDE
jgi:hypothetical protein